jgi:hypothetical protein
MQQETGNKQQEETMEETMASLAAFCESMVDVDIEVELDDVMRLTYKRSFPSGVVDSFTSDDVYVELDRLASKCESFDARVKKRAGPTGVRGCVGCVWSIDSNTPDGEPPVLRVALRTGRPGKRSGNQLKKYRDTKRVKK